MAKHHYVAQTYLKHFGDASHDGRLHVYKKLGTPEYFTCWPQDVCHEWNDDLNPEFLPQHPKLLGDFRKFCEPHWNQSIQGFFSGIISDEDRFIIAAYFANLMTCTPAWRRVGATMHNQHLMGNMSFAKKMKEKHGGQDNLPVEAIEMMERGEITLETEPAYIKAVITRQLIEHTYMMFNQNWTILKNNTDQVFITSDNPVAVLYSGKPGGRVTRFLPITPQLCLSVTYDTSKMGLLYSKEYSLDCMKPSPGKTIYNDVNKKGAKYVNRNVAMCAENMVFSSKKSAGLDVLVKKYAIYGIDAEYIELPGIKEDAIYQISKISVRERL
jgi:hypothetical protein